MAPVQWRKPMAKEGEKESAALGGLQLRHANIALTMPRWIGGRAMASGSRAHTQHCNMLG